MRNSSRSPDSRIGVSATVADPGDTSSQGLPGGVVAAATTAHGIGLSLRRPCRSSLAKLSRSTLLLIDTRRPGISRPNGSEPPTMLIMNDKVTKTDAEWREQLDPTQYAGGAPRRDRARRSAASTGTTGTPGSTTASAAARRCSTSDTKFDAGCGWPSYSEPINSEVVERVVDRSHGMVRDRGALQQLRLAPRPRLRGRPGADRRALLHQLGRDRLRPAQALRRAAGTAARCAQTAGAAASIPVR